MIIPEDIDCFEDASLKPATGRFRLLDQLAHQAPLLDRLAIIAAVLIPTVALASLRANSLGAAMQPASGFALSGWALARITLTLPKAAGARDGACPGRRFPTGQNSPV